MSFTKQTTLIVSHFEPGYVPPPGVMNPYMVSDRDVIAYENMMDQWVSAQKTDGIQYSNEVGTSIRRWADEAAAQEYLDYTLDTVVWPYGVQPSEVNYLITSIPGSEEPDA